MKKILTGKNLGECTNSTADIIARLEILEEIIFLEQRLWEFEEERKKGKKKEALQGESIFYTIGTEDRIEKKVKKTGRKGAETAIKYKVGLPEGKIMC